MSPVAARPTSRRPALFALIAAAFALAVDQAHKLTMLFLLDWKEGEVVRLLPVLDHVLVWNHGISFGLFQQDDALGRWLLLIMKLAIVAGLAVWAWRTPDRIVAVALGLIIGGAIGNGIDRAAYGAVADFFHFHVGEFSWYVFNLADCAIVGGVALLLYDAFRTRRPAIEKP
jgi:signal peptidase II